MQVPIISLSSLFARIVFHIWESMVGRQVISSLLLTFIHLILIQSGNMELFGLQHFSVLLTRAVPFVAKKYFTPFPPSFLGSAIFFQPYKVICQVLNFLNY